MDNLYFDNVIQIGKLYLEYVFYEFESEPILFTCIDEEKKLYLCLCSEIRYGQKWVVTECSIMQLKALIEEEVDIASVFLSGPRIIAIEMDLQGNESSSLIENNKIDRLDLPKEGTCIRCNKEKARNYLWNKKWEVVCRQLKSTMDATVAFDKIVKSYKAVINETIELLCGHIETYRTSWVKNIEEQLEGLEDTLSQSVEISQEYCVEPIESYAETHESVSVTDTETDDYIEAA